jgi:hypothetical protein
MSGVLVHNQGDILHRLGTKPASHLVVFSSVY